MKKVNNGHRWTNEEMKTLIELWHDPTISTAQISERMGVSHVAVLKIVRRMKDHGVKMAARKSGNSSNRHSQCWTQGEVEYLLRRRNEKATSNQIAVELGRTWNAVQAMIYKLRTENVEVKMLGNGVRRLWDADALKAASISIP